VDPNRIEASFTFSIREVAFQYIHTVELGIREIVLGMRLTDNIKVAAPERVATDCLSCRLQFQQMLPYEVFHPIEILREAYRNYQSSVPG
jgi:Fe-S oxidoreductase